MPRKNYGHLRSHLERCIEVAKAMGHKISRDGFYEPFEQDVDDDGILITGAVFLVEGLSTKDNPNPRNIFWVGNKVKKLLGLSSDELWALEDGWISGNSYAKPTDHPHKHRSLFKLGNELAVKYADI